jgi:hypothetical protein
MRMPRLQPAPAACWFSHQKQALPTLELVLQALPAAQGHSCQHHQGEVQRVWCPCFGGQLGRWVCLGLVLRDREDSSSVFGIYLKAPHGSACLCSSCVPIKGNGIGGTVSWSCFRDHLEGDCSHSHVCPERFLCTSRDQVSTWNWCGQKSRPRDGQAGDLAVDPVPIRLLLTPLPRVPIQIRKLEFLEFIYSINLSTTAASLLILTS